MAGVDEIYREEFQVRVLAGRPRSILDIGSGSGAFLRPLRGSIGRLAGVDPSSTDVEYLRAEGFDAYQGEAEALPFQDGEFDVAVFSFVPHHVRDWNVALQEAKRVARHSIEILDVWFDDTVADQKVAHAIDRWRKEIDRRTGMMHNDTLTPGQLVAPLLDGGSLTYDYVCRRVSSACKIQDIETHGRAYLARVANDAALSQGLEQILADARRHGVSEAGCVQMTIELGR